jgi:hypothetical protein
MDVKQRYSRVELFDEVVCDGGLDAGVGWAVRRAINWYVEYPPPNHPPGPPRRRA